MDQIPCLTPSNVLPFYVTAETGSVECPGFAALSTLLICKPGSDQPQVHDVLVTLVFYALQRCFDMKVFHFWAFFL